MNKLTLILRKIKIVETGAGGGHSYIKGICQFEDQQNVKAYAYFPTKKDEKSFEKSFKGQDIQVTTSEWDFTKGIGLNLNNIRWELIKTSL